MTLIQVAVDVALAVGAVSALIFGLYRVVGWARRRQKRAYAIGAALAPFMAMGLVVDPDYRIVHEAKQHKKQEEDDSGDPPSDEDESDGSSVASSELPPESPRPTITRVLARRFGLRRRETFA